MIKASCSTSRASCLHSPTVFILVSVSLGRMIKRGFDLKIIRSHHGSCDDQLMQRLQEVNENVENRIAQLRSFSKKTKAKQKAGTLRSEWLEEHNRLNSLQFKLQKAIDETWTNVITTAPDEANFVFELLERQNHDKIELQNLCELMRSQLDDLHQMMRQIPKSSSDDGQDLTIASSVVADVIVQYRHNHATHSNELYKQELALRAEVASSTRSVMSMINDDMLRQSDQAFSEEILRLVQEDNKDLDVSLDTLAVDIAEVIYSFYERLRVLDEGHAEMTAKRDAERLAIYDSLSIDPTDTYQGWEASDHDIFCKIFKKAQVTGMKRKIMMELLTSQLPSKSMDDILLHEEWYRKMKLLQGKYKDAEAVYKTNRQDLMNEARKAVADFIVQKKEEEERDRLLDEQEMRREALHRKLSTQQEEKEREMRAKLEEMKQQEAERRAQLEEEDRRREAERSQKKELVQVFRQQRLAILEEKKRLQLEEEAMAAAALKEEIERNRSKVEQREKKLEEKLQQRKQREVRAVHLLYTMTHSLA